MVDRGFEYLTQFFFGDLGLGSLHGGFGLIFWGLCFPSLLYLFVNAIRAIRHPVFPSFPQCWEKESQHAKKDFFPFFFWGQFVIALAALFYYAVSIDLLSRSGRLILYVTGLGLVALGVVWPKITSELAGTRPFLKLLCLGGVLLTFVQLGNYRLPMLNLQRPLSDRVEGNTGSPFRYLFMGEVLESLDLLTQEGRGLNVYVAAPHGLFFTTHFYGSKVQNRIWNFQTHPSQDPDAFVFFHDPLDRTIYYLNRRIAPEDVIFDPRYLLILHDVNYLFFLKRSVLENPVQRNTLSDFYGGISFQLIPLEIAAEMDPNAVILTSTLMGYAFRHLELANEFPIRVVLAPAGGDDLVAQRLGEKVIYSLGRPLRGYQGKSVKKFLLGEEEFEVFRNVKEG
jgi:hypothetical protein